MYRYFNQEDASVEDKLILTKVDNKALPLLLYVQTKKRTSITGATCKVMGVKGGEVDIKSDASNIDTYAKIGTITTARDNSPFETASRWQISAPLTTTTLAVSKDTTIKCEYTFDDSAKTKQTASYVVYTWASTNAAATYVVSSPADYMTSYSDVEAFMTKSTVTWSVKISGTPHYNVDVNYNTAGLLSTAEATKYASWVKKYANVYFGAAYNQGDKQSQIRLSSNYPTGDWKFLDKYYPVFVAASTTLVSGKHYASPAYVAYMPIIQTSNGTAVYATAGTTVTLTCSIYSGIVEVAWFKGTEKQSGWHSYYKKEDKRVYTKFIVENIKHESQGTYACAAGLVSQKDNPWPAKHEITLFVVEAQLSNAYAPIGQNVTLTCSLPASKPPDEVLWYGNGKLLSATKDKIEYDSKNKKILSLHTITNVKASDFGAYKAIAYFNRSVSFLKC
jgi:hypothetical protein